MLDLVGNQDCLFSQRKAQFVSDLEEENVCDVDCLGPSVDAVPLEPLCVCRVLSGTFIVKHNDSILFRIYARQLLCVTDRSKAIFLWRFFLFYVLVFKFFVLLAPYVWFHILVKFR